MSILDVDLELLDLVQVIQFDRSPLTDIKRFSQRAHIGLIEGGVCNDENVHVLRNFRENCDILISLGECAIMGGLPAMRNSFTVKECLEEAYLNLQTTVPGQKIIPQHEDLPKILNKVHPLHDIVKIDYFLPGCPPSAKLIAAAVKGLVTGNLGSLPVELIKYD
jgi:[NiFe] hydrogenase diaphorase moiety small subunit